MVVIMAVILVNSYKFTGVFTGSFPGDLRIGAEVSAAGCQVIDIPLLLSPAKDVNRLYIT